MIGGPSRDRHGTDLPGVLPVTRPRTVSRRSRRSRNRRTFTSVDAGLIVLAIPRQITTLLRIAVPSTPCPSDVRAQPHAD